MTVVLGRFPGKTSALPPLSVPGPTSPVRGRPEINFPRIDNSSISSSSSFSFFFLPSRMVRDRHNRPARLCPHFPPGRLFCFNISRPLRNHVSTWKQKKRKKRASAARFIAVCYMHVTYRVFRPIPAVSLASKIPDSAGILRATISRPDSQTSAATATLLRFVPSRPE